MLLLQIPVPSTAFKLTIDSERKIRLLLINPDLTSTNLIKSVERYTWQEKNSDHAGNLFPADTASILFFNASPDVTVDSVFLQGTPIDVASLASGGGTGYMLFAPPSNYSITFKDTVNLASASIGAQSKGKYSAILYGTQGNLQAKVYTDD